MFGIYLFPYLRFIKNEKHMKSQEIKLQLLNGQNFSNESANWFSLCKPSQNIFLIVINDKNIFFKNIDSAAKRIAQLLNRGY